MRLLPRAGSLTQQSQGGGVRTHARQHLCAVTGFQDQQLQPTRSLPEKRKTPLAMNGVCLTLKLLDVCFKYNSPIQHPLDVVAGVGYE